MRVGQTRDERKGTDKVSFCEFQLYICANQVRKWASNKTSQYRRSENRRSEMEYHNTFNMIRNIEMRKPHQLEPPNLGDLGPQKVLQGCRKRRQEVKGSIH